MIKHRPIYIDCEQRSEEWHNLRKGVITASCCELLFTARKEDYINKLLSDKLVENQPIEELDNEYIRWGIAHEGAAREAYELFKNVQVFEIGFVYYDDTRRVGCSPDGLVDDDGLVEIKCPMSKTHIDYLRNGIPKKYYQQIQFQLYVTGRDYCDFISFDPRLKDEKMRLYIQRIKRDSAFQLKLHASIESVLNEVETFKLLWEL